ncbi:VC2046/SO_2500 family protein [Rheinheimera sp. 4Y26]|uniref:VC2046/SO_2500 family protein n=1 Tax=Rheinheimera sp. 4Y26 TaxID=2977811 RepID=UPI0021B0D9AD|nr:VC2046/SO_2500 family protein [Rheinheimera sp. 4Y26]MCT6699642.1 hypothetical protein [Rheinheimera sp. 4Y26]
MLQLVNEWQLQGQLNQALLQHQRADFALWLAMLSPAVDEMAAFCLPTGEPEPGKQSLYHQLGVQQQRDFAMQQQDIGCLTAQHQALIQSGLVQCRLQQLLTPPPAVVRHDAKKLSAEVLDSLDFHTRRHLAKQKADLITPDPTALYDILQEMHA